MATTAELKTDIASPIIIDLGKRKKKDVKQLRNGSGKLADEIKQCIDELVTNRTCAADAQPIILIVREKTKANRLLPIY